MVKKNKIKKLKTKNKKVSNGVNIKINIDQSKRSNRKAAGSKSTAYQQPIYYPQQQARLVEIKPSNYSSPDFTKTIEEYQKQQREYFDNKLSNYEKEIIEKYDDSLKKKSTMVPQQNISPGASHQYTDYEGNEIYNETIVNKKAVHNQINNLNEKKPINFQNNNMLDAEPLTVNNYVTSLDEKEDEELEEAQKGKKHNTKLKNKYNEYVNLFNSLYPSGKDDKGDIIHPIDLYDNKATNKQLSAWNNTIKPLKNKISKKA